MWWTHGKTRIQLWRCDRRGSMKLSIIFRRWSWAIGVGLHFALTTRRHCCGRSVERPRESLYDKDAGQKVPERPFR